MEDIDGPLIDGTNLLEVRNGYIAQRDGIEQHHPDKAYVRRTAKAFDALVHDICRVNRRFIVAQQRADELRVYFAHAERE